MKITSKDGDTTRASRVFDRLKFRFDGKRLTAGFRLIPHYPLQSDPHSPPRYHWLERAEFENLRPQIQQSVLPLSPGFKARRQQLRSER